MTTQNDTFASFIGFQKEALEPVRAANGFAADTFERLFRQHYAVIGDCINFAVEQARLPVKAADYNEYFTKQVETTRSFGEQIVRRTQEYVEIVSSVQAKAQAVTQAAVQNSPVAKAKAA
ncbi:MAG: phasin family protein [Gammaproteobacteria bacterium]